jgi:NhaA family Na+:H+ antiporter
MFRIKHKIIHPLQRFIQDSRAIGIVLTLCTIISLIAANTGSWQELYRAIWITSFDGTSGHQAHIGFLSLPNSPSLLINDALMSLFFFLVGMEIKRELLQGELASAKKAMLPVFAAIGGMVAPALLFSLFNKGGNMQGWAIPTATDIAFTIGITSILGKRVPVSLKIFITALAIIDDLLAIIVIAFFYGAELHLPYLAACALIMILLWSMNKAKIRFGIVQGLLGFLLWYCMYQSGIHATIAGVLFAWMIPVSMLTRFELKLHAPVYFLVMPVFAVCNTAIAIPANIIQTLNTPLSWGIIAGLCIGKPLGIWFSCYILVKKKWAEMPEAVNWHQLVGAGIVCGIGFTMSIFISTLAFTDSLQQDISKISVLVASLLSAIVGMIWLSRISKLKIEH